METGNQHGSSAGCLFCHKSHPTDSCSLSVLDRIRIVSEQKRCYKCFDQDHLSYECKKPDCPICGQNRHEAGH